MEELSVLFHSLIIYLYQCLSLFAITYVTQTPQNDYMHNLNSGYNTTDYTILAHSEYDPQFQEYILNRLWPKEW
jgi:hypothetical protein